MSSIYDSRQRLKYLFILVAMAIAVVSVAISDVLIHDLAEEERQKMDVFATAQRVIGGGEDPSLNMELILKIIEGNTTIPVMLVDENDHIISYNNIEVPEEDRVEEYLQERLQKLKAKNPPIQGMIEDDTFQYVYYDDSIILKRLAMFPYGQLAVLFGFIAIAFLALASTKRAEQNKVWVGLSKETAHQLGTPISSLIAWMEYLRTKEVDPVLLKEMGKDVDRLEMIADRFSKIGSNPDPLAVDINESIRKALEYMNSRISSKVTIDVRFSDKPLYVNMNDSLFSWVIENLLKNAVDAMEGQGMIVVAVEEMRQKVCIDVTDNGKGIVKSKFKEVFSPGYTTKARGWGLGLSLVKRIIESYHKGKIFVKNSEIGKGTTFRMELKKLGSPKI